RSRDRQFRRTANPVDVLPADPADARSKPKRRRSEPHRLSGESCARLGGRARAAGEQQYRRIKVVAQGRVDYAPGREPFFSKRASEKNGSGDASSRTWRASTSPRAGPIL